MTDDVELADVVILPDPAFPVPERLFPIITRFREGSLIIINTYRARSRPEIVEQYIKEVKKEFSTAAFFTPCLPNPNYHEYLRRCKNEGMEERSLSFCLYEGQDEYTSLQQADFSFHLNIGFRDSLIVELGKCRTPIPKDSERNALVIRN